MSINNQHKPGYKHTPIGWIPEEWESKQLRTIGEFKGGGTPNTNNPSYWNGKIPWVSPKDMKANEISETEDHITEEALKDSSTNLVAENSLLIVTRSGILRSRVPIAINRKVVSINQDLKAFKLKENDCIDYMFHFLTHKNQSLLFQTAKVGTTVESLDFDALKSFQIALPPLNERKKIAAILSTWDEAISKTQQLITQLQLRNKGLMQQLLTAKDNWFEKKLADIFDRVVRKNINVNTNVITISAQRGFVKQNDFFKKLVASETLDNYFLVRKGEFCYNKSYSNGYDWGATKRLNDFDEAVVTTLYICFRIKNEKEYSGDYFEYFFDANILDRGLAKIAHEGGRAHGLLNVTPGDFFSLKFHVPPYYEQIRIFKILSAAKNELKLTEQKLAALQQQKKGLMQKLLTGEVRVKIDNSQNK